MAEHHMACCGRSSARGHAPGCVNAEERRDFDEVEQAMIRKGNRSDAKVRWHERTGR